MSLKCPHCSSLKESVQKNGFFIRKSDSKKIQRYLCISCKKHFSRATFSPAYYQKKRRLNPFIRNLICSCVSMRRTALILNISRTTVAKRIEYLYSQALIRQEHFLKAHPPFKEIQFDDLETFEHTKCKPLSLCLVVGGSQREEESRKILGFCLAQIPAKGLLAAISRKKYGKRPNEIKNKREELFKSLRERIHPEADILSDSSTHYLGPVRRHFPKARHRAFKGVRGCVSGQGELKKIARDPLFNINHTFAMLRDNLKRLSRRTWCTTKKVEALEKQVMLYVDYHNQKLLA